MVNNPPPPDLKEAWPVLETDLVKRTGMTLNEIRAFRKKHLVENIDYGRRGRRIAYTVVAAADLVSQAGLSKKDVPAPTTAPREVKGALPLIPGTCVELKVWRSYRHGISNMRIVEAHFKGSDPELRINIVRVKVANNRNFMRGMTLWGRLEQADLYEHWDPVRNVPGVSPR